VEEEEDLIELCFSIFRCCFRICKTFQQYLLLNKSQLERGLRDKQSNQTLNVDRFWFNERAAPSAWSWTSDL